VLLSFTFINWINPMITWTNIVTQKTITCEAYVLDSDKDVVRRLLEEGAIVSLTPNGEFAFASHTLARAIRCASAGDFLIWPDGLGLYCSESRRD
jgi:hypothetical protein